MEKLPDFEIVCGTYEEFLLGYKAETTQDLSLKQSFATHEHSSSLRTIACSDKYVATGGADDRIHVYDMDMRKEHIMLLHHNSTVNCLEFTAGTTHLVSSSVDGVLAITRVGNWVVEKMWEKSHKNGYVVALAIHPTGKLALTLGSDGTLQTWNLIKGRKAYTINLNSKSTDAKSLNFIKWAPDGENFILGGGNNIEIWNISSGGIVKQFNYKNKVTCAIWLKEKRIAIGHESGVLTLLNVQKEVSEEHEAHSNRIKCLEYKNNFLVTAASSGIIKLWSVKGKKLTELCECNSGCRITCIALVKERKISKDEKEESEIQDEESKKIKKVIKNKQRIIIEGNIDDKDISENNETIVSKKSKKRKKRSEKTDDVIPEKVINLENEVNMLKKHKKSKTKNKK